MSTAYSSAKQQYIGNGVTTEWGFDFPIKKHSELKVYLKRSEMPQVLLEEGVDYSFVTENTIAFPIKTGEAKLQAADVLALQRESVFESEYNFSNQQRLEPEEVMHSDDNLERQIQELKRDSESSIKVLPTSSVDPNTFFEHVERVYGSVDNIDTVANDKANVDAVSGSITNVNTVAGSIESVKTVANNIESVVVDATNIADIKTVARSITNVNKTAGSIDNVNVVAPSISSVNTVAANISSVNTAASNMAAIKAAPTAASNAAQSAANAANSATISANSAIWAEGTDAQVQALGGVHSSKVWAQQSTNANIALTNSPYTTNRILEIPQDIKLELNNGTLTLKAGSKVYAPNGTKYQTTVDRTYTATGSETYKGFLFVAANNGSIQGTRPVAMTGSGSSLPSDGSLYRTFFNTTNQKIYAYSSGSSSWVEWAVALPIAVCTISNGVITSIDQIFNGFGYIGSTVFALPGVKVQAPNGKNEDGTYRSIIATVDSVKTKTITDSPTVNVNFYLSSNLSLFLSNRWSFDADKNMYVSSLGVVSAVEIAYGYLTSGRITSFEPYTVDSVANSNEFYQLRDKAVTTNTAQTITAAKTLSVGGTAVNANVLKIMMPTSTESNPTTASARTIDFFSSSGAGNRFEGGLVHQRFAEGGSYTGLRAGKLINGTFKEAVMGVRIWDDGTTFGTAPSTPDNAPATAIVTKNKIANMVTTNTAQAITGTKTFKGVVTAELEPINFIAKNPTMGVNETPSANKYVGYDFRDKNNVRIGYIGICQGTDGTFRYEIQSPGNYAKKIFGITPSVASGGIELVTAEWFNSKMQVVSALPANPDPNVFYFIPG